MLEIKSPLLLPCRTTQTSTWWWSTCPVEKCSHTSDVLEGSGIPPFTHCGLEEAVRGLRSRGLTLLTLPVFQRTPRQVLCSSDHTHLRVPSLFGPHLQRPEARKPAHRSARLYSGTESMIWTVTSSIRREPVSTTHPSLFGSMRVRLEWRRKDRMQTLWGSELQHMEPMSAFHTGVFLSSGDGLRLC